MTRHYPAAAAAAAAAGTTARRATPPRRRPLTVAAGALVLGLTLAGCSAGAPASPDGSAPSETAPSETAPAESTPTATPTETATASGPVDCMAVGNVLITFTLVSFNAMSTERTSGELASSYRDAATLYDSTTAPSDAPEWSMLGQVIHAYADEWAAIDPASTAIDHIEPVEDRVDAFAESIGFDNDDYEDTVPIVGAQCDAELDELLGD